MKIALTATLCSSLIAPHALAQDTGTRTTYDRVDEVLDYGAATTRLIVDMGVEVLAEDLDPGSFSLSVNRSDPRLDDPVFAEGELAITEAYVSDDAGNRTESGRHVTLVPDLGPDVVLSQALNYANDADVGRGLNTWTDNAYTIRQTAAVGGVSGLVADQMDAYTRLEIEDFAFSQTTYEDAEHGAIDMPYATFSPQEDGGANPLIVWLHGGGEGGDDPTIPLAANRAVEFAAEGTQEMFGGAYVLVPQSSTWWMHGPAGKQGVPDKADALSIYTRAVQSLVEETVSGNDDIDPSRIYVAGASNGGFLTLRLILDNPDYYAAAVAICQAMNMDYLPDGAVEGIVDVPLWLVTAATDTVVDPAIFVVPFYDRLRQLGAQDVHLSFLPAVTDTTGRWTGPDGEPYEYFGHASWVPAYNNHLAFVDGGGGGLYGMAAVEAERIAGRNVITLWEWLASKSR